MALPRPKSSVLQMAVVPRLQGDGMDSEALRQQELSPQTQRKMLSHRRNLNASHKAATVSRSQQPKFIPKEPVKGAVKAVGTESSSVRGEQKTPRRRSAPVPTQYSSTPMNPGRMGPPMAQPVSPILLKTSTASAAPGQNPAFQPVQMIPYTYEKSNTNMSYKPVVQNPVVQSQNGNTFRKSVGAISYSSAPVGLQNVQKNPPQVPARANHQTNAVKPANTQPTNTQPTMTVNQSASPTNRGDTVLTVQVPVYQGPGHLHPKTYETLRNNQMQLKPNSQQHLNSNKSSGPPGNSSNIASGQILTSKGSEIALIEEVPEKREVEGQDKSYVETLNESLRHLQEKLDVQLKVNGDLKKMLVASMGDDLHYRVEALVRTKAHLAQEVGGYSEKLCQGYEEVDKLAIQADMWHSKYRAAKLLVEELTKQRGNLHDQSEQVRYALQMLLQERHSVKDFMVTAHKHLHQLKDALGPHMRGPKVTSRPTSVLDLGKVISQLADGLRGSLLGSIPAQPTSLDSSTLVSPAEQIAYQVLFQSNSLSSEVDAVCPQVGVTPLPHPLATPLGERYPRFHPHVRYHNLTLNCCRKCKGDIHVV